MLVNVRIVTRVETVEGMIEHGIVIVVRDLAGAIEMIEERLDGMLDAMTMNDHQGETATFLKDGWREEVVVVVAAADVGHQEAIGMNLRSKWAAGTGRKARVLHPRRRSLHLI